jgi:hypothetical protein
MSVLLAKQFLKIKISDTTSSTEIEFASIKERFLIECLSLFFRLYLLPACKLVYIYIYIYILVISVDS